MNAQTPSIDALPDTTAAGTANPARKRAVLGAVALAAAAYFGHAWWFNAHYVETDNAQIDGHIIPVAPKIGGFIAVIPVHDNQAVKAGDVLVQMDDRDYRSRLAQAEAELAQALAAGGRGAEAGQAVAQLGAASAQAQAAQADIAQAQADAERSAREAERLHTLLAKKLVSPQQYDSAEAAARAAQARLASVREAARAATQQVSAAGAALRGADARLEAARAARDIAAHQLADTRIVAAVDSIVSQKNIEAGQLVQMGQPLMNLVPVQDTWITANLKETQIRDLRTGNAVVVEIDAYPGLEWTGKLDSFSPATGAKFTLLPPDNATGNFTRIVQRIPVKVRLEAGQHPGYVLRPGMNAKVRIAKSR
ncbi:MAG: HlyD family secretion protein [Moraxellaceae bacterium]|jgi:membrane fusion protein (multidrug efflux system)|nr:HlyD family secretion protein [Moraxellaceae bacterium]